MEIKEAYEVLKDPLQRRQYDSGYSTGPTYSSDQGFGPNDFQWKPYTQKGYYQRTRTSSQSNESWNQNAEEWARAYRKVRTVFKIIDKLGMGENAKRTFEERAERVQ